MSNIRTLPDEVTRVITTSQVITTLAGACRELIDNALDAGATNIEVRLRENGAEAIEVVDNGHGVDPADFGCLAQPHCTSKLRSVTDLDGLTTFGFRGEALNALVTFADVIVTTRSRNANTGTKLIFDHLASIVSQQPVARQPGTTVTVNDLFTTLPVRRQELLRTIRKEVVAAINTIQAFALSRSDVKFTCSNTIKGKRNVLLTSPGGTATLLNTISSVFGIKTDGKAMVPIPDVVPSQQIKDKYGCSKESDSKFGVVKLSGYVSTTEPSYGSHSAERQFFFVNGRHVGLPKAAKVVNEVYRAYNKHRYPIVVLFIDVHPSRVNPNVTPDKRTVTLRDEVILLVKLRGALEHAFEGDKTNYVPMEKAGGTLTQTTLLNSWANRIAAVSVAGSGKQQKPVVLQSLDDAEPVTTVGEAQVAGPRAGGSRTPRKRTAETGRKIQHDRQPRGSHDAGDLVDTVDALSPETSFTTSSTPVTSRRSTTQKSSIFFGLHTLPDESAISTASAEAGDVPRSPSPKRVHLDHADLVSRMKNASQEHKSLARSFDGETENSENAGTSELLKNPQNDLLTRQKQTDAPAAAAEVYNVAEPSPATLETPDDIPVDRPWWFYGYEKDDEGENDDVCRIVGTDYRNAEMLNFEGQLEAIAGMDQLESVGSQGGSQNPDSQPMDQASQCIASEDDTKVAITKGDFTRMTVLWQFNKAFIFCTMRRRVFIVDQHAADEKFNYEELCRRAALKKQHLIHPIYMSLSPVHEQVLISNLEIFSKNGFEFKLNDLSPERVHLSAVPSFHNFHFGINDVEEMLSVLTDAPGQMYRPEKVKKILMSKACRSSIMVGDLLTRRQMKGVVAHLAGLKQPWNCPHGRPTVRLLRVNVPKIQSFRAKARKTLWAQACDFEEDNTH